MRGTRFTIIALLLLTGFDAGSQDLRYLTFNEAERLAIENSPQIIAQQYTTDSAYQTAGAKRLTRLPTLGLNAESYFITKVGQITVPQLGVSNQVGSHTNWSVYPTLNFTVWDTGQITNMARSLRKTAEAQGNIVDMDKRQVLLTARVSYINVQFAKEQVRLVKEALALAKAQYAYVLDRFKAGTSDKFDLTVAHQEMVDKEKALEQTEGQFIVAKRALVASLALENEIASADIVDVEPLNNSLNVLVPRSDTAFDAETHPQVKALANQKRSAELAAKSVVAQYAPTVGLQGTAGFQYPNLGVNETVQQNKLLLNLKMPIFEWGTIWKETKSQKYQASSADKQRDQTMIDLTRDATETKDWIGTYKRLQVANVKAVKDAVEVAQLSFDSYKAGRIIFLDVQRANVKELSVKVDAAQNDANLAVSVSKLLALAVDEEIK